MSRKSSVKKRGQTTVGLKTTLQSNQSNTSRLDWLDQLRGLAVLAMMTYHFAYDLNHFGWLHQDLIHDWRWRLARSLILSTFLLAAGFSLALAEWQSIPTKQRWQRIGRIAAAAVLVTAGSYVVFPQAAIWFGVLHALSVMSVLLLLCPSSPMVAGTLALAVLGLGNLYTHEFFNQPLLAWLGCMTRLPRTEDYVPLLPWFAVCLVGYAAMKWALQKNQSWTQATKLTASLGRAAQGLRWLGQHSLAIYLLHQPVLFALLYPLSQ